MAGRPDSFRPSPDMTSSRQMLPATEGYLWGPRDAVAGGPPPPVPLIDRDRPVLVLGRVATHRAEIDVLQLLRELTDLAVADRTAVDLDHRRDLSTCSAQQKLLARVELGPVDASFHHWQAELVLDHFHQQGPGDAFEDVVGDRGRDERAVLEHEQVLGRTLGDVAVDGQHYRLVESTLDRFRLGECRLRV